MPVPTYRRGCTSIDGFDYKALQVSMLLDRISQHLSSDVFWT